MEHTKEPWAFAESGDYEHENYVEEFFVIVPADKVPASEMNDVSDELARVGVATWRYGARYRDIPEEVDEANARRIVACVNACEGILTERLEEVSFPLAEYAELYDQNEELLKALKVVLSITEKPEGTYEVPLGMIDDIARAAITTTEEVKVDVLPQS